MSTTPLQPNDTVVEETIAIVHRVGSLGDAYLLQLVKRT